METVYPLGSLETSDVHDVNTRLNTHVLLRLPNHARLWTLVAVFSDRFVHCWPVRGAESEMRSSIHSSTSSRRYLRNLPSLNDLGPVPFAVQRRTAAMLHPRYSATCSAERLFFATVEFGPFV